MGCCRIQDQKKKVPVQKNIIQSIILGKNKWVKKKVKEEGVQITRLKINFRGDTILHYACKRNNRQLIIFFKKIGADFTIKNQKNQAPIDLVKDSQILQIIKGDNSVTKQLQFIDEVEFSTHTFDDNIQENVFEIKVLAFDKNNRKKMQQQKQIASQIPVKNQITQINTQISNLKIFSSQLTQIIKNHMQRKNEAFRYSLSN